MFGSYERELSKVFLEGEAFFEVIPDKNKPFIVDCGKAKVVVLGTSFNIKAYPGENIIVTVKNGRVFLAKSGTCIKNMPNSNLITKGQNGIFSLAKDTLYVKKNDNINYLAWKDGVLKFKDTRLKKVARVLENHFNVEIKIKDKRLKRRRLTANFDNMELDTILEIIKATLGIDYIKKGNTIVFIQ